MSLNSSSSSNGSHLHPNISSSSGYLHFRMACLASRPSSFILMGFYITTIFLLLPLCIFIIYHGLQQWRQKRSTSSAATMSHSDCFTYHMVIMELLRVFGCVLYCCGIYSDQLNIIAGLLLVFFFIWFGETFFHVLTCVDRYLAVVHPVTYLNLRRERGVRMRNMTTGCVWLLCAVGISLAVFEYIFSMFDFCILALGLTVVSFCSLSVLRVLIRPGPGEQGGGRERVDQSKQRAFYTIMVILGVLVVRFAWGLVRAVANLSGASISCLTVTFDVWFNLPSSLVLPLLFLHRSGKLVCWKKNI